MRVFELFQSKFCRFNYKLKSLQSARDFWLKVGFSIDLNDIDDHAGCIPMIM